MGDVKAMKQEPKPSAAAEQRPNTPEQKAPAAAKKKTPETGGPAGPEPTRYGDWEIGGRGTDF